MNTMTNAMSPMWDESSMETTVKKVRWGNTAFLSVYSNLVKHFFQGSLFSMLLDTLTNRTLRRSNVSIIKDIGKRSVAVAGAPGSQPKWKPTVSAAQMHKANWPTLKKQLKSP